MNIVHLVHNFPPEFVGGTERYLASLVRWQKQAGHEVSVITGSEQRSAEDRRVEDYHGIEVLRLFRRPAENYGVLFEVPRLKEQLYAWLNQRTPDLIHVHHWFNLSHSLLSGCAGPKVVATLHDSYLACPRFFFLRPADGGFCGNELPVPVQRCVDCIRPDDGGDQLQERLEQRRTLFAAEVAHLSRALVPSRFHGDLLIRSGVVPAERVEVLPLGIDPLPAPEPYRPNSGKFRLASFGNLSLLKGIDLLLEAVAALPQGTAELHLFGDLLERDADRLRQQMQGLPVIAHGSYRPEDLVAAAPDLDLAVFPSRAYETYSLVLEEAVALGLPVVVSDRGALPQRVRGFGCAVPVEDVGPLRQRLLLLQQTPEQLAVWRAAVPEATRLEQQARLLHRIYQAVVAEQDRREQ